MTARLEAEARRQLGRSDLSAPARRRYALGLSQRQLADAAFVSVESVGRYERNPESVSRSSRTYIEAALSLLERR